MNTSNYRYQLDSPRITGRRQQKTTCPQCGRKKCFVRYVDTHNNCKYLSDDIGRCDHEQSCGYHRKPGRPSTSSRPSPLPLPCREGSIYHCKGRTTSLHTTKVTTPLPTREGQGGGSGWSGWSAGSSSSNFWQWMLYVVKRKLNVSEQQMQCIFSDYCIDATRDHDIIFWQIDYDNHVRTGHIMRYSDDGKRNGYQDWVHSRLIHEGKLPQTWTVHQCLYGEHLLRKYPGKQVCIVESEKTALVMAATQPKHLWLATAGCGGLNAEKLTCLEGRRVTLFPDSGCYDKWKEKMQQTTGISYYISPSLETYPPNTDLADIVLDTVK